MFDIGQVVISTMGRDKNQLFMIFDKINDQYVLVVNGDNRKFDNPKKKNIKHLKKINNKFNLLDLDYNDLQSQNKKINNFLKSVIIGGRNG